MEMLAFNHVTWYRVNVCVSELLIGFKWAVTCEETSGSVVEWKSLKMYVNDLTIARSVLFMKLI